MEKSTPWQISNVPGPKMATVVKPEVVSRIIKNARRPMLIVGAKVGEDGVIERVLKLSRFMPVVATAHSLKRFLENHKEFAYMGVVEITNLLKDNEWKGLDGQGGYDLVLFLGIEYWLLSQMASTLKHFSEIVTLNLSRYYQPHTNFSFSNLTSDVWLEYLDEVIKNCEI